jgi:hypothetical protein
MQNGHIKSQDLRITGECKYHDTERLGVGLHFLTKTYPPLSSPRHVDVLLHDPELAWKDGDGAELLLLLPHQLGLILREPEQGQQR